MEEIERPKTPRRRRAASTTGDATAPDGTTLAKPARRRTAPKAESDAADAVPKPPRAPAKPHAARLAGASGDAIPAVARPAAAEPLPRRSVPRSRKPAAAEADPAPAETVAFGAAQENEIAPRAAEASIATPDQPAPAREADSVTPAAAPAPSPAPAAARPPAREPDPPATAEAPAKIPSFARKPEVPKPRAVAAARPADTARRPGQVLDWLLARLPQRHRARAHDYLVLMRMDRPVGALLLLWPTWWALWFAANDFPPLGPLVIFTLGVFVMRAAGCVINDYADHGWLDAKVERTAGRPMAAGRVSKKEALLLFGGLLALAFVLVLFTNALTIQLSFVGAALAAVYPFTKRVTHLAQVVLGAAFGWSIPMAFAAVTNSLPPLCWLLFLANILFSTVYDTEYAMVDRDEDIRAGSKSTAILFGDADRAIIGVLMATFLLAMLLAGTRAQLAWPYFVGLAAAAGLFGYQQWLIRARDRMACFAAFRHNNWVGLVLWVGLAMALAVR